MSMYWPVMTVWSGAVVLVIASRLVTAAPPVLALWWAGGIGLLLAVLSGWEGRMLTRRQDGLMRTAPAQLAQPSDVWPGWDASAGALGWIQLMLATVLISWPAEILDSGAWPAYLLLSVTALASSIGLFYVVQRRFSVGLADLAFGLFSVAVLAQLLVLFGGGPVDFAARLHRHLVVLVIGSSVLMLFWGWLFRVWSQQLDAGIPWTTAGRLHGCVRRWITGLAVLAGLLTILLAIWPLMVSAAEKTHGWGALTGGIIANLVLLVVLLVNARRWRSGPIWVLAGVVVAALVLFIVVRVAPFVRVDR